MVSRGFKEEVAMEQGLDVDSGWIEIRREKGRVRGREGGDQPDGLAGDLGIFTSGYIYGPQEMGGDQDPCFGL